jgi:hypothetical protein
MLGSVFFVLFTIIFSFWNLIRGAVYAQIVILSNDNCVCYVDTADTIPKIIENRNLKSVDKTTMKFGR